MQLNLLHKKLKGELSPNEEKAFLTWLNASPKHRHYFERFKKHYSGEEPYQLTASQLASYRKDFQNKLASKRFRRWRIWGSCAAAAMLAGVLSLHFLIQEKPQPAPFIAELTEMLPETTLPHIERKKESNKQISLVTSSGKTLTWKQIIALDSQESYTVDSSRLRLSYPQEELLADARQEQFNELIVGRGSEFYIELSDGTRVWMNADSKLKYPIQFMGNERRVKLEGEAYFEVAKNANIPFIVETADHMQVRVYGTEFNVNARDRACVRTTLVNGSVGIQLKNEAEEVRLTPGFSAEVNTQKQTIQITDRDIELYVGWKNGQYYFEDTRLDQFFEEIERWYDIQVTFENETLKEECFTGCLPRDIPLKKLLRILEKTNYLHSEIKGKHIIIKQNR